MRLCRFENQDSTRDRLEEMQEANKAKLTRLEEEREKLEKELERLKFTGETKLSRYVVPQPTPQPARLALQRTRTHSLFTTHN